MSINIVMHLRSKKSKIFQADARPFYPLQC